MRPGVAFLALFLGLFLLALSRVVLASRGPAVPGGAISHNNRLANQRHTILHQGMQRHFLIHLPSGLKQRNGPPAVIVLHGGGGTPEAVARLTGFNRLADKEGFIVVYPEAINRHWNDGRGVKEFRAHREEIDDVGFISSLIDTLIDRFGVDARRVYAAGISNGGMMCQRLGCEIPHRLAGIATVAAAMPENVAAGADSGAPVSILMINGTADPVMPFEGGAVGLRQARGRVLSVEQTVAFWVKWNRCAGAPLVTWLTDPDDSLPVKMTVYQNDDGVRVVLYTVLGGGHTWPGGRTRPAIFGKNTDAINATRLIWEFFQGCRR